MNSILGLLIVFGVAAFGYYMLGSGSMNLSPSDIAQYASNAGWTGSDLVLAVAVALAESGGNPGVTGDLDITPGGSVGLWQINLAAHPDLASENLTDPQTNANAAFSIYAAAGNSFSPWTTYKNIALNVHPNAQDFISEATAGVNSLQGASS
jgi:hypothetical protein